MIVSGGAFGRYHAFLPQGTHTLRIEASGYQARDVPVTISANGGAILDVELDRVGGGAITFCSATANSTGQIPTLTVVGSASITQNQFLLVVEHMTSAQPAYFFMGQTLVQRPVFGGVLCVDRLSFRFPPAPADLFGYTSQVVDLVQPIHPLAVLTAGSTWGFQLLYRDPAAGGWGLNFSPAVRVTFCP